VCGPLAHHRSGKSHAGHPCLRAERNELCPHVSEIAAAEIVLFFCEYNDRTAFWSFIRERGELCRICKALGADIRRGVELGSLTVSEGDGAGLIEQQGVYIACGFDGSPRHS